MDERSFKAWEQIASKCDDPTATQIIKMGRRDLKSLTDEIARLREELKKNA